MSVPSSDPEQGPSGTALPFVSVVMPIRNEGAFIERSLGAVLAQDYPPDRFEVIVVDGCSTDDTRQRVESLLDRPVPVRLLANPGKIVPTAMNIGIRMAKGEIIVRVDGHTIIARDYVSQAVVALGRTGAQNVGGLMTPVATGYLSRAITAATSSPFGVGGSAFHYAQEERETDTVYLGCYPKRVLEHLGLYDEEFVRNQDDELNYRLKKAGGRIVLVPSIRSEYHPRTDLRRLARQYFQYGWWKVRVFQKHPRQLRKGQFAPGAFALAFFGGPIFGAFSSSIYWLWMGMVSSWLIGAVGASFLAARTRGWSILPVLPPTFLTLHLSYGLGFLAGLVRFARRWSTAGSPVEQIPATGTPRSGASAADNR